MQVRLKCIAIGLGAAVVLTTAACSGGDPGSSASSGSDLSAASVPVASATETMSPAIGASSAPSTVAVSSSVTPSVTPSATSPAKPVRVLPAGLTAADVNAGLLSARFINSGSGKLMTVPGNVRAPSRKGTTVRVKVQVESGLKINGPRFAAFVMATLNDPRSWGHGGTKHFDRVDGDDFDFRVVMASPNTSASMCAPLRTFGKLSCHSGSAAILTIYRWVNAIPDYGKNRTGYREYLVNHEVGHALGHGHQYCAGKGRVAPVMQQQTKSLQGCKVNPWPFP